MSANIEQIKTMLERAGKTKLLQNQKVDLDKERLQLEATVNLRDGLMEEVKRYYSDNFEYLSSDQPTLSILTNIARHFAEWGAEHLRDSTKMIDKSLEEAAYKYSFDSRPSIYGQVDVIDAFKAGAEWQASQMPMPEDTVLFNKGVAEGRRLEKEEKDLGWISVKDRLPEKDGWYFTCVEMSGVPQCVGLSHFETYSGQWDDDDDSIELVDYWMEIPALPKEEEK